MSTRTKRADKRAERVVADIAAESMGLPPNREGRRRAAKQLKRVPEHDFGWPKRP